MVFAQVSNNTIKNIIELDDISLISSFQKGFDSIIQIDSLDPQPGIGWKFDNVNWNAPIEPKQMTTQEIYTQIVADAMNFGQQLVIQVAVNNILMGITQSGKTQAMINYTSSLRECLMTGSLYAAIDQLNIMIAGTGDDKTDLYPFITNDILTQNLHTIQSYLGMPLT